MGGTITLHSIVNGDGCRVVVADDGVGLPDGETWPKPGGKLGALIARSLTENAKAQFDVSSSAGEGTKVTIAFKRSAAAELPAPHCEVLKRSSMAPWLAGREHSGLVRRRGSEQARCPCA